MARNLPEVELGTSFSGTGGINTPLQGAGSAGISVAGGDQGSLVPRIGELCLSKKALSGCAIRKLKKAKANSSEAGTGDIQQPGTAGLTKQLETPTETPKRPRSEGSTPSEMVRPPKRPRDWKGPGNYKEALTNIKVAIFKDTFPEDKVTVNDQDCILEELGKMLRRTPTGELPHLKSYRLEGGALIYTCADQQSSQRLIRAIDNHRLGSRARLKATDARNLPKPIKMALRVRDKVAQTQDELLRWIQHLNPGLHTENWRVLGRQSEPMGQILFLHIDQDSLRTIQKTGYKIFMGLSQGIVKVLKDPEMQREGGVPSIASSGSASEGEEDGTPSPSRGRGEEDVREGAPPSIKPPASEPGTLKAIGSESMETVKEDGMETDPPPLEKEQNTD
jgi:hypothetical protein